jgi:hypothetical protein
MYQVSEDVYTRFRNWMKTFRMLPIVPNTAAESGHKGTTLTMKSFKEYARLLTWEVTGYATTLSSPFWNAQASAAWGC